MMKIVLSILVMVTVLLQNLFAGTEFYQLEQSIENKIRPIVQRYDENALVFVKATKRVDNVDLPGTAVTLRNHQIESEKEEMPFSKLEIRILTKEGKIPDSVKLMVERTLSELRVKPNLIEEKLPSELSSTKAIEVKGSGIESTSGSTDFLKTVLIPIALGSVAIFIIFNFINSFVGRKHSSKLLERFENSFKEVVSSLSENGGERKTEKLEPVEIQNSNKHNNNKNEKSLIAELPLNGFETLFIDCYWSHCDDYAAHVWIEATNDQKKHILNMHPLLKDYIRYISRIEPMDRGYASDSHYLAAIDINHLNNEALTELVKKEPALFKIISNMRKENLNLSIEEQIALSKVTSIQKNQIDFKKISESKKRSIEIRDMVIIRNLNEEDEIVKRGKLSIDEMALIPTLGWLNLLETPKLQEILQKFNARDLATAWVGPESVLESLAKTLPEKKLKLLKDYSAVVKPNRYSPVFRKLHELAIEALKSKELNSDKNDKDALAA